MQQRAKQQITQESAKKTMEWANRGPRTVDKISQAVHTTGVGDSKNIGQITNLNEKFFPKPPSQINFLNYLD